MKKIKVLFVSALVSISLTGCSSNVSDERLESFSLDASSFGSEWKQVNQDASNFRNSRVGDLCQLDYLIRSQGGESVSGPKMITQDRDFGTDDWDASERIVYANLFAFTSNDQVRDVVQNIQLKIRSCSRGNFLNSTENGVLRSESDVRTFTDIGDIESLIGISPDAVLAFDYVRVESRLFLNTNNDYSDDSKYESRGRVIVISAPKSILLVTSAGQTFKKYEPAPSIEEQNLKVAQLLKLIFGPQGS